MRYHNKSYWKIPSGEIQYGHVSRSIVIWFRGRRWLLKK